MPQEALLKRVGTELLVLQRAEAQYADVLAPDFDPFDFFARREMRLSQVIAWMLDPRGAHAQGSTYLRQFLNVCTRVDGEGIGDGVDLDRTIVDVERPVFTDGDSKGRIDIEVVGSTFLLLIENKPDADFQHDQLARYRDVIGASTKTFSKLVILRGWGEHDPEDRARGDLALSLGQEVAEWVQVCARLTKAPDVRSFLERFYTHLLKRFSGVSGGKELSAILNIIGSSPENIQRSIEIASAVPTLKSSIISSFYETASVAAKNAGLAVANNLDDERRLPNKYGIFRVSIGRADVDFAVQCDRSDLNDASYGICLRKASTSYKKQYGRERDILFKAWGSGEGEDGNEWWVWWDSLPSLVPHYASHGQAGLWASFADHGPQGMLAAAITKAKDAQRLLA